MLTPQQLNKITEWQLERQKLYGLVPKEGKEIEYLGKKFIVYKNVFWPIEDSQPLVENYIINPGESVLDICTGSGVIAIFSAYKGAGRVVALDINPDAVKTAKDNVLKHGFKNIIEVKLSDMFTTLDNERFDVITGNLPFRNLSTDNLVAKSQWDSNLSTHKSFFKNVNNYLKPKGRIYLSQANYGAVKDMKRLAKKAGFIVKLIGQKPIPIDVPGLFYAFELKRSEKSIKFN